MNCLHPLFMEKVDHIRWYSIQEIYDDKSSTRRQVDKSECCLYYAK